MSEENVELARAALNWFAQLDEGLVAPETQSQYFAQDPITTLSGANPGGASFRMRARASEVSTEVPFAHLITWRDGKATALSMYTSEAAALEAAGLSK